MATITKKKTQSKVDEILSKPFRLILHNDDYNTFDHVNTILNYALDYIKCTFD